MTLALLPFRVNSVLAFSMMLAGVGKEITALSSSMVRSLRSTVQFSPAVIRVGLLACRPVPTLMVPTPGVALW